MIGRKVRCLYPADNGVVEAWEPLSSGMCDVLVRNDAGHLCWHASTSLRENDGLGPLPSRAAAREAARVETLQSLHAIRRAHAADRSAWPGADFGKALISRAIEGAIDSVKGS